MNIPEYFGGKNILITGATGLMGKSLVEKLLRSCPDVSTIYAVIRTKKGENPEARWSKITKLPLFDMLRSSRPNALDKVVLIPGESTADFFGISEEHGKVLKENVNVIYHVAASVNFNETLYDTIKLNIRGTISMFELAKNMKNLECFVYVSTAYAFLEKHDEVKEEIYDSPWDLTMMLKLLENPQLEEQSTILLPKIMNGHGTFYTITKRTAETLVKEYGKYFPIVVIRPGIVIATASDPFPGWVDAKSAFSMIDNGIRVGFLRVMNTVGNRSPQLIPLDHSIKAFIIATWLAHVKQMKSGVDVYCTCLGGVENGYNLTWKEMFGRAYEQALQYPAQDQQWYPAVYHCRSRFLFRIVFFFLHVIPAILSDFLLVLVRLKPRALWRNVKIYNSLTNTLRCFLGRDYHFDRTNYIHLNAALSNEDKKSFLIDQSSHSALHFYQTNYAGMVRHVYNEDMSPEALNSRRRKLKQLKYLHFSLCSLILGSLIYCILGNNLRKFI